MPTVAEQLRTSREAQGLTIYQVAEITKIKSDHLRALEEARYDSFAAPVYIRGFVRNYARLLRLDEEATMTALEAELRQTKTFQDPPGLAHAHGGFLDMVMLQFSKVNWRVALPSLAAVFIILAAVFAYRAWVDYRTRDPLADLGPGLYETTTPASASPVVSSNSVEVLPLPPVPPP